VRKTCSLGRLVNRGRFFSSEGTTARRRSSGHRGPSRAIHVYWPTSAPRRVLERAPRQHSSLCVGTLTAWTIRPSPGSGRGVAHAASNVAASVVITRCWVHCCPSRWRQGGQTLVGTRVFALYLPVCQIRASNQSCAGLRLLRTACESTSRP
jgi:hypothetical protein